MRNFFQNFQPFSLASALGLKVNSRTVNFTMENKVLLVLSFMYTGMLHLGSLWSFEKKSKLLWNKQTIWKDKRVSVWELWNGELRFLSLPLAVNYKLWHTGFVSANKSLLQLLYCTAFHSFGMYKLYNLSSSISHISE